MPIIEASGLTKTYRVFQKQPGLRGAVRSLFRRQYKEVHAVEDVHFSIEPGENSTGGSLLGRRAKRMPNSI